MFRFAIRELLTFTLAAGLAVGWWIDHRTIAGRAKLWQSRAGRIADLLGDDGWAITWSETTTSESVTLKTPNGVKHLFRGR